MWSCTPGINTRRLGVVIFVASAALLGGLAKTATQEPETRPAEADHEQAIVDARQRLWESIDPKTRSIIERRATDWLALPDGTLIDCWMHRRLVADARNPQPPERYPQERGKLPKPIHVSPGEVDPILLHWLPAQDSDRRPPPILVAEADAKRLRLKGFVLSGTKHPVHPELIRVASGYRITVIQRLSMGDAMCSITITDPSVDPDWKAPYDAFIVGDFIGAIDGREHERDAAMYEIEPRTYVREWEGPRTVPAFELVYLDSLRSPTPQELAEAVLTGRARLFEYSAKGVIERVPSGGQHNGFRVRDTVYVPECRAIWRAQPVQITLPQRESHRRP